MRLVSLLSFALTTLLALALTGCTPGRTGGDDDDDDSPFGDLDSDGDGDLDADDVEAGEAAVFLTLDFVDEDGAPIPEDQGLTTTDVRLEQTYAAWNLAATFGGDSDGLSVNLRFELEGELETGTWAVSSGSAQPADGSWYAYSNDAGGDVDITGVGDGEGSGHFSGEAELDVLGEAEQPTGEVGRVTGFAFRAVPIVLPDM